jgi:hypothetical protein
MRLTPWTLIIALAVVFGGAACAPGQQTSQSAQQARPVTSISIEDLTLATGQVVFVPAYSEVFFIDREKTLNLAVTLAIHNTDLQHPIIIKSARYYDTYGNMVQEYAETPVQLAPMETMGIVLDQKDDRGGFGANFIVEWAAETQVYEPVVEAVMINTAGSQGISLLSPGRVISQTGTINTLR